MASIKDVAELAGVSIATVSRTINYPDRVKEKTRLAVEEAIVKTGYSPNALAQSFRRGKTNIIFVVIPDVGVPFFSEIVTGIRSVAAEQGYGILIHEAGRTDQDRAAELNQMLVSRQADGIILLASASPFGDDVISSTQKKTIPIVIGCETMSPRLSHHPSIHIDNIAAAKDATRYLISMGHKRIAFIYGEKTSLLTKDRELGYSAAMKAADLPISKGWIVEGQLTVDGAIHATRMLLNHPDRPTAIFCANDEMALGALHEVRKSGMRVPEDISIVGFDDIRFAEIAYPPLTTVYQPAREIGEKTMYRICRMIDDPDAPRQSEIVSHKLIVRQSAGPPPKE